MSLSEAFLEIQEVTFGYGARVILDDVTLKFGRGQVVAIMGGSGMGKTTLLKLIGGLITPQKGRIIFDRLGRVMKPHRTIGLRIKKLPHVRIGRC